MEQPQYFRHPPAIIRDGLRLFQDELNQSDVSSSLMESFIIIADRGETTAEHLVTTTGLSQGGMSKIIAKLSEHGVRFDKPGHGLITARENPYNRRQKLLTLTNKGKIFWDKLKAIS